MNELAGKKILLGITGSIAAYKAPFLVRLLKKAGAEVQVILTEASKDFVSPLALSTVAKREVLDSFYKHQKKDWNNHVDLGLWADLMLIAPCSANTMAKMANGVCDNLLLATYLSAKCPVWVSPAMDLDMWLHPSTQRNVDQLKSDKVSIIEPTSGELASGLVGKGRMEEPEKMVDMLQEFYKKKDDLKGKSVLVTAGPTHEALDPVRFIGNHSSGKMGYALAQECVSRGAKVILVSGPVNINKPAGLTDFVQVTSANEMFEACKAAATNCDIIIKAAAVADFSPENKSNSKIKKKDSLTINLKKGVDILKYLGDHKQKDQILIGFALETDNEKEHARDKLKRKNLDMIVLNSLNDKGAGFGHDTNKVTLITKGDLQELPLLSKAMVATEIIDRVVNL